MHKTAMDCKKTLCAATHYKHVMRKPAMDCKQTLCANKTNTLCAQARNGLYKHVMHTTTTHCEKKLIAPLHNTQMRKQLTAIKRYAHYHGTLRKTATAT